MNNTFVTKSFMIFFLGSSVAAHAMDAENEDVFPKTAVRCDIVRLAPEKPSGSLMIQREDKDHISLFNFKIEKGYYHERLMQFMERTGSPEKKLAKFMLRKMPQQTYRLELSEDGTDYSVHLVKGLKNKDSESSPLDIKIIKVKDAIGSFFQLKVEDRRSMIHAKDDPIWEKLEFGGCKKFRPAAAPSWATLPDCIGVYFKVPAETN